jgi:hypothetical protein
MRLWARDARRPFAWWQLETDLGYPGRDRERSALWRANQLAPDEKVALEREWRREFDAAQAPDFSVHDGVEVLSGDRARHAHYAWADIPEELVAAWSAERTGEPLPGGAAPSKRGRRRRKAAAPQEEAAPAEEVVATK